MNIKLRNTLSGKKDEFKPLHPHEVSMYHCGPTVYGRQHIGNLSMFVFTDILRRTFEYFKYNVKQVINITDFGHLSGDNDNDADTGEDKMMRGLKAEGLEINMENMKKLAHKYAGIFMDDIASLNVKTDGTKFPFASEYVEQQKTLIERLEGNGFTYTISDGVYFDTDAFPDYGKLGGINIGPESRIGENKEKKNQRDFALWKLSHVGHGASPMSDMGKQTLGWDSKWGKGFPGWHIECTAMIFQLLGEQIDIHTGGIEHIGVHHNNEIAQAECASGLSPFARIWLHREHLKMNGEKIAKSTGNVLYISDLAEKGIHPLSFRYWLLTSRYDTSSNFTWEAVEGAQTALEKIVLSYATEVIERKPRGALGKGALDTLRKFENAIADDLNTPVATSLLQEATSQQEIDQMDAVLGLNIKHLAEQIMEIPDDIKNLQKQRDEARRLKNWKLSDNLRYQIESKEFIVSDADKDTLIYKTLKSVIV